MHLTRRGMLATLATLATLPLMGRRGLAAAAELDATALLRETRRLIDRDARWQAHGGFWLPLEPDPEWFSEPYYTIHCNCEAHGAARGRWCLYGAQAEVIRRHRVPSRRVPGLMVTSAAGREVRVRLRVACPEGQGLLTGVEGRAWTRLESLAVLDRAIEGRAMKQDAL